MSGFEGSYAGRAERIHETAALECGVCWWVYDPRQGDAVWQVPAGTPFSALPAHWRCPVCDAPPEQFMVVGDSAAGAAESGDESSADPAWSSLRRRLLDAYQEVDARMRSLPVYRADLQLRVLGPVACPAGAVAVLQSPWCMNLLLITPESRRLVEGTQRDVSFPSGDYTFTRGELTGVGAIESCSLFSPMEAFEDDAAAAAVAAEVLAALLVSDEDDSAAAEPVDGARRRFLGLAAETHGA